MADTRSIAGFRFGYGLPLPLGAADSAEAMISALAGPDLAAITWPSQSVTVVGPLLKKAQLSKIAAKRDPSQIDAYTAVQAETNAVFGGMERATLARALDCEGMRERLVAFWADHFTVTRRVAGSTALPLSMVEDAIRPNLGMNFEVMLSAVETHPAMLRYLDQTSSFGPNSQAGKRRNVGLNENLARELMELHTLGVGAGYTQADVREMAALLTGLVVTKDMEAGFDPRRAEPGAETVLGKSYGGDGLAPIRSVLRDLAVRPETAAYISGKLVVHFVSDTPDPTLVAHLTEVWLATGGNLLQVYAALLRHPAAWVEPLEKVRQPYDFVVASLRALGLTGRDVMAFDAKFLLRQIWQGMGRMGQPFKDPRGPDGWAEEADFWITPQGLAQRIDWAMATPEKLLPSLPDPVDLAHRALGGFASDTLLLAASRAESVPQGVGLVLASPQFNRR